MLLASVHLRLHLLMLGFFQVLIVDIDLVLPLPYI
ncbi:hypothetical protein BAZSYMB_GCONTIG00791_1 [Bathymodiolus azoricus thioautotrophic gill symbiont]|uniref:Uncharacterized protein n=1 Tax=Bathymodiolus azoricus thioautotrophic gill symbiont TaxID=235205 RepID=A0A1H6KPG4_9GAMM|nr:hypothetical protein BAZSYMB_GCONTIG00791_1 [Bathymodiolus azoricus thioautotrophic gill symbiont]